VTAWRGEVLHGRALFAPAPRVAARVPDTAAGACAFNGFPFSRKVYLHIDGWVEVQPEATIA